jgi:pentatricopeptide repeat protein
LILWGDFEKAVAMWKKMEIRREVVKGLKGLLIEAFYFIEKKNDIKNRFKALNYWKDRKF